MLAKSICAKFNPKILAMQLSAVGRRDFQNATFLLAFIQKANRSKYAATVRALDWGTIERTIGDDWANLSHESEIFIAVSYNDKAARELIQEVIFRNLPRIEKLSPRVACIAPKAAFAHVEAGKTIRLAQHDHCAWQFAAVIVAQFAQERPDLLLLVSDYPDKIQAGSGKSASCRGDERCGARNSPANSYCC
ncbi:MULTISPECIES: hypothetical protein [Bradyrhizobium]|uniref:hypothetical protein n=1 Tax=Bradyrhizobium TaxID=374 RepID=UPI0003F62BDD|nr:MULTISPECIES: hypothetical protein [Bradyrhizobium]UFW51167.1 hypothetical protein BaraCB756_09105 [Bradyrhizobium arachidis]